MKSNEIKLNEIKIYFILLCMSYKLSFWGGKICKIWKKNWTWAKNSRKQSFWCKIIVGQHYHLYKRGRIFCFVLLVRGSTEWRIPESWRDHSSTSRSIGEARRLDLGLPIWPCHSFKDIVFLNNIKAYSSVLKWLRWQVHTYTHSFVFISLWGLCIDFLSFLGNFIP